MNRHIETQVLIVGAGPVGLLTANLLADQGVRVAIIDREERTGTHSYACALHPHTLEILHRLGLADEVVPLGRKVHKLAFHDGTDRRAEVDLSALPGRFPFVLVVPQTTLEDLLERRLADAASVAVRWNHRLSDLRQEAGGVCATVDKLGFTSKGYVVAELDPCVEETQEIKADFVVGADGRHSGVRRLLGIEEEARGNPESFSVYEFEIEGDAGNEMHVTLNHSTSVLWPLEKARCRWSFGRAEAASSDAFPAKDRSPWRILNPAADVATRQELERLIGQRAPWFRPRVTDVAWSTVVAFEHRLARQFGRGRCWLAGDAGHQTGPVGMQSANVGMSEAANLAARLTTILRDGATVSSLDAYEAQRQQQWRTLLGFDSTMLARADTDPWIRERAARILSCLPASGDDLKRAASQLGLEVP